MELMQAQGYWKNMISAASRTLTCLHGKTSISLDENSRVERKKGTWAMKHSLPQLRKAGLECRASSFRNVNRLLQHA
eukprot:scaffold165183_cov12-Tisochrysis_lutea.AAC.1